MRQFVELTIIFSVCYSFNKAAVISNKLYERRKCMEILLYVPLSALFFYHVIIKLDSRKTVFILKCYCVFMMPLAIEALIRIMTYVRDIWSYYKDGDTVFLFLRASIQVFCFCVFTLLIKNKSLVMSYSYILFMSILLCMVAIFPFVSLTFEASFQVVSAWGCTAAALYGLSKYSFSDKEITMPDKKLIIKRILRYCVILIAYLLILSVYHKMDPRNIMLKEVDLREIIRHTGVHTRARPVFSPEETVDITDILLLKIPNSKYFITGSVSVVYRNGTYFTKYNIEAWLYCRRGVPSLLMGAYRGISTEELEHYKKSLASNKLNFNSPDFDSYYDGIGDSYYRIIHGIIRVLKDTSM